MVSAVKDVLARYRNDSATFPVMPALVAGIHDHRRRRFGIAGDHGLPGQARQ
jgi:hypothetical protein